VKQTLKNIEVNDLFKIGKWISTPNISAIYSNSTEFKYMVSAPYKNYKRANQRNKIKRLLREGIYNSDIKNINIAFIYKNTLVINQDIITKEIKEIFNRIK